MRSDESQPVRIRGGCSWGNHRGSSCINTTMTDPISKEIDHVICPFWRGALSGDLRGFGNGGMLALRRRMRSRENAPETLPDPRSPSRHPLARHLSALEALPTPCVQTGLYQALYVHNPVNNKWGPIICPGAYMRARMTHDTKSQDISTSGSNISRSGCLFSYSRRHMCLENKLERPNASRSP